jgi:hypothetical protein
VIDHVHVHEYGPWQRVDARGGSPASRADDAWAGLRRFCPCGAYQHRSKDSDDPHGGSD